ncbi:MAG: succinate dehydrogenase, cytochrome b556 subunit [Rhodospirillaceae bacterium]|nr:succinate dehydrogenase, cytochrome b556 subunit [Rhodospirillaceae bacterium]MYB14376.1 succinate dehydrogenase, cytochrome b556 subunit [Rhodospirillaceae bacterium]
MASDPPARRDRPLSPHLQVYKPQWTSVLSILHRITGVALALGTLLLVWWLAAAASSAAYFAWIQGIVASWPGIVLLIAWAFALYYHLCNGIRHLFWDAGIGLELGPARASGMVVLAAATALTVLSAVIALTPAGAPA